MKQEEHWPAFDDDEIEAVVRVLRSGRVNRWTGEENRIFETDFAAFVGAGHAVALANGTVALELALRCNRIGSGDDVIVTSRSFVASAAVPVLVGARPVFADIDPESQSMTAETIQDVLTDRTRAIIVVHLGGWIADMDPIMDLARERNLIVVEDCAQALGATRQGRPAGSWGHVAAWSFCQDKHLTTGGEGGMLTTDNAACWERAWSYKDHGKDFAATEAPPSPHFRWVHHGFGSNLRMTEMQAAIGRVGLPKVHPRVDRRIELARVLDDAVESTPAIRTTPPPGDVRHAYYKYYAFVQPSALRDSWSRDRILDELQRRDVPAYEGICPEIYREEAFVDAGAGREKPHVVARMLGETAIMLPIHHNRSDETVSRWASVLKKVATEATR